MTKVFKEKHMESADDQGTQAAFEKKKSINYEKIYLKWHSEENVKLRSTFVIILTHLALGNIWLWNVSAHKAPSLGVQGQHQDLVFRPFFGIDICQQPKLLFEKNHTGCHIK